MLVIAFDVAFEGGSIRASRSIGEDSHEFIRLDTSRDDLQPLLHQHVECGGLHSCMLRLRVRQTERSPGHDAVT